MSFASAGTSMSVFDFAGYVSKQSTTQDEVKRIHDGYLWAVREERAASPALMGNIEQSLVAKVLSDQGFEIKVKESASSAGVTITDPNSNPYLKDLWMRELSTALIHGFYQGFAAIQVRTIHEPGTDPMLQLREELAQQNLEEDQEIEDLERELDTKEKQDRFFRGEKRRLLNERPRPPPDLNSTQTKSYRAPRTMLPLTEYFVGRRKLGDGTVRYEAYWRDNTNQITPIPDSFVFIFREPDEFGVPSSMFLDCLADIQVLRTLQDRYELRDYANTSPVYVYQTKPHGGGQAVIPNETHMAMVTATTGLEEDSDIMPSSNKTGWKAPKELEENSLDKRKKILEEINKYMQEAVRSSIAVAEIKEPGTPLRMPKYHFQLGHLSSSKKLNQLKPFIVLPDQMELSSNVPRVIHPTDWPFVIRLLQTNIANACSLIPQVITGERAVVGADIQLNRDENNARIRKMQRQMERLIGTIYIQAFAPLHKQQISYSIQELRHQRRMRLLVDVEAREQLRHQLQREYERLTAEINETDEERARAEVTERRTEVLREINRIPDFDMNSAAFPWDAEMEPTKLNSRSSEYWRITIEQQFQVQVHVFENPTISFEELQKLVQARVLDEQYFRELGLRVHGLPMHYISKLPIGEIFEPQQPSENGAGNKPKAAVTKGKAEKKQKDKPKDKARKAEQDKSAKRQKKDKA